MKLRELLETDERICTVQDRERHDYISLARDIIDEDDEIVYVVANHYGVNDERLETIKRKLWFQKAVAKILATRGNQPNLFEYAKPVILSVLYNLSPTFTGQVAKQFFAKIAHQFNGQVAGYDNLGVEMSFPDVKSASKAEHIINDFAVKNDIPIDAQISH